MPRGGDPVLLGVCVLLPAVYVDLHVNSGPEFIKLCSCSAKLSIKFIMLINIKMPTIVGILIFISMINKISASLKARKVFSFQHFSFHEQLKLCVQLS